MTRSDLGETHRGSGEHDKHISTLWLDMAGGDSVVFGRRGWKVHVERGEANSMA